jgi:hypothetical protein
MVHLSGKNIFSSIKKPQWGHFKAVSQYFSLEFLDSEPVLISPPRAKQTVYK